MIDGCLEWQRNGLRPPQAVRDATAAYLESEDAVASWIEEKCERDFKAWESLADLFASWTAHAERAGEYVGSRKSFAEALEVHGLQKHKRKTGQGFYGLRLNS